jgi:hypothetical protein
MKLYLPALLFADLFDLKMFLKSPNRSFLLEASPSEVDAEASEVDAGFFFTFLTKHMDKLFQD